MSNRNSFSHFFSALLLILFFLCNSVNFVFASTTDGTMTNGINSYAELLVDGSRVNFGTTNGNLHVTNSGITGYAWGESLGWINMSPTHGGVANANGTLSGYAWGDTAGWVNFSPTHGGVTIDAAGRFAGYAWAQNFGWIYFGTCPGSFCVATDWRPTTTPPPSHHGPVPVPSNPPAPTPAPTNPPVTPPANNPTPVPETPIPPVSPTTPPVDTPTQPPTTQPSTPPPTVPVVSFTPPPLLILIRDVIRDQTQNTESAFNTTRTKTKDIIDSKIGSIATKIITAVGVVASASATIAGALFLNPLSFSEIFLIPLRLWSLLMTAFGLKKRTRPWGVVYDSITKQPLDPAYVVLMDKDGNEVTTSITDIDGRYGFLVNPGTYKIVANKTNYTFPSQKLLGRTGDEVYGDLYFGEEIIIAQAGDIIAKNIPLDPLKFDWNEFAKQEDHVMKFYQKRDRVIGKISAILFTFGFAVSTIALIAAPKPYNITIFGLYVVLFVLRHTAILRAKPRGTVQGKDGYPLSFAIIRVFSQALNKEITHKIVDKTGKYYCLIPNGNYYVKIEKKNPDATYTEVFTSGVINVTKGYLNEHFEV